MEESRGVSPVISVILVVAIAVILAATISVFVLDFTEDVDDPAPNIGQTSGEFVPGANDQEVRITHVAGDSVRVENIEIVVRASGPSLTTEARLVELPAEGSDIDSDNIQGDSSLIDESTSAENQVVVEDVPADDNRWDAGDTVQFAINVIGADFRDPPASSNPDADELEVVVVYTGTESSVILYEDTFRP